MNQNHFQHVDEAISWIHSLLPRGIKPGLRRMEWLMERLDHPERRLKFIHIAGTNGKGSTASYLAHILQEANYDVGLFTSPYIEKFTNRIKYNGQDISNEDLVAMCNLLKPLVDECEQTELGSPTEFEVITAIAIQYFAKVSCPYFVVFETGLGGRLDSTNIITPLVSVITNIGYDHMNILGDTLPEIALEKAGIIKSGVPVVSGVTQPEVIDAITRVAKEKQSPIYIYGQDFYAEHGHVSSIAQNFSYKDALTDIENIEITLMGPHQVDNAGLAVMTLSVLKQYFAAIIDEEELRRGFQKTTWPGRFERLRENPTLIIDGAHNAEGATVLRKSLETLYPEKKIHVLLGLLKDKSIEAFLHEMIPIASTMTMTSPDSLRAMQAIDLAEVAKSIDPNKILYIEQDWKDAIAQIQSVATLEDVIVMTGSLYLIADIRKYLLDEV
ncbi:MAG: folylpolyglutamate synthase/dihydrofolate synthase family protein [Bacilli bacterium]